MPNAFTYVQERLRNAFSDPKQPNIVEQLVSEYPALKKYDLRYTNSINKPTGINGDPIGERKMEFYPPNEGWNPNNGSPTIEQFSNEMTSKDALGEVFSHYLPSVNPVFKNAKIEFQKSITPEQKKMLLEDYDHQVANKAFGNKIPTEDEYLNNQGLDAYFRGYPTGQYPSNSYTESQKALLNRLVEMLKMEEIPNPNAFDQNTPSVETDFYSGYRGMKNDVNQQHKKSTPYSGVDVTTARDLLNTSRIKKPIYP